MKSIIRLDLAALQTRAAGLDEGPRRAMTQAIGLLRAAGLDAIPCEIEMADGKPDDRPEPAKPRRAKG